MKVDLKIGFLHAYPNSDLQFENLDFKGHDLKDRAMRAVRDADYSSQFDKLSTFSYFTKGSKSLASEYRASVRTPNTHAGNKSVISKMSRTGMYW